MTIRLYSYEWIPDSKSVLGVFLLLMDWHNYVITIWTRCSYAKLRVFLISSLSLKSAFFPILRAPLILGEFGENLARMGHRYFYSFLRKSARSMDVLHISFRRRAVCNARYMIKEDVYRRYKRGETR